MPIPVKDSWSEGIDFTTLVRTVIAQIDLVKGYAIPMQGVVVTPAKAGVEAAVMTLGVMAVYNSGTSAIPTGSLVSTDGDGGVVAGGTSRIGIAVEDIPAQGWGKIFVSP